MLTAMNQTADTGERVVELAGLDRGHMAFWLIGICLSGRCLLTDSSSAG
jgi:hypothetical protein